MDQMRQIDVKRGDNFRLTAYTAGNFCLNSIQASDVFLPSRIPAPMKNVTAKKGAATN